MVWYRFIADGFGFLVIWGDDIGWSNTSAYHRGMLGGSTPNIDRIAREGALFIDYCGEQSCIAGRSAFITGQQQMLQRRVMGGAMPATPNGN